MAEDWQHLFTFPPGADVVGIEGFQGKILVATTRGLYEVVGDELTAICISKFRDGDRGTTPAIEAERARCSDIVQAARNGEIDTDLRTIIHFINSGQRRAEIKK